jgi:hypothetical protein
LKDAHSSGEICNSVSIDAFDRWDFVHPVGPIVI